MMPLPVTFSAFGISMFRPATWMPNLPGTLKASSRLPPPVRAPSAAKISTLMSKVPSRPVSRAVMPLLVWLWVPWVPPKPSVATSTPMAIVSTNWPPLNCVFASPTDGPSSESGPSTSAFVPAAAVCSVAEIVKSSSVRMLATAVPPVPTCQLPATIWTFTSPATNVSFGSTPVRGVNRYRYVLPDNLSAVAMTVPSAFLARFVAPTPVIFSSLPSMLAASITAPVGLKKVTSM